MTAVQETVRASEIGVRPVAPPESYPEIFTRLADVDARDVAGKPFTSKHTVVVAG